MPLTPEKHPQVFIAVVVVSLLLFYTAYDKQSKSLQPEKLVQVFSFSDANHSFREFNKVAGLAAIGLISVSLMLGPLSRMFPKTFAKFLSWRKPVGIAGFAFAVIHAGYSFIEFYKLDVGRALAPNAFGQGFLAGVGALIILFLMAVTSTQTAMQKLGYQNWKVLQTFGYLALLLAVFHFIVVETKPDKGFDVRPFALIFLFIPIVALLLRAGLPILRWEERRHYGEHFGEKKPVDDFTPIGPQKPSG